MSDEKINESEFSSASNELTEALSENGNNEPGLRPDGEALSGVDALAAEGKKDEISELSKKGYQLLKDNRAVEAMDCFAKILDLDEGNNYARVGMGDAAR
jgi:hypothetical protein